MKIEQPPRNRSLLESLIVDGFIIGGMALLGFGAWLAWPPAGYMVGGAVMLALGVIGARR